MADVKISELPAGTATANAVVPATNAAGTTTQKITLGSIAGLVVDASQLTSGTLADARLSANIVRTNDARLTDARTPTSHTHTASEITDFNAAAVAAAPPTIDASLLTQGTLADARLSANIVRTNDARLSDARTPTAHQHALADVTNLETELNGKVTNAGNVTAIRRLTQAQYDALTPSSTTLYIITG